MHAGYDHPNLMYNDHDYDDHYILDLIIFSQQKVYNILLLTSSVNNYIRSAMILELK